MKNLEDNKQFFECTVRSSNDNTISKSVKYSIIFKQVKTQKSLNASSFKTEIISILKSIS